MGDLFRQMNDEKRERERKRKKSNTELLLFYQSNDVEYDFEVEIIAPYHLRITTAEGKRLDYFPTSNKATWVGSQEWFKIPNIELFIMQNLKATYGKED